VLKILCKWAKVETVARQLILEKYGELGIAALKFYIGIVHLLPMFFKAG